MGDAIVEQVLSAYLVEGTLKEGAEIGLSVKGCNERVIEA